MQGRLIKNNLHILGCVSKFFHYLLDEFLNQAEGWLWFELLGIIPASLAYFIHKTKGERYEKTKTVIALIFIGLTLIFAPSIITAHPKEGPIRREKRELMERHEKEREQYLKEHGLPADFYDTLPRRRSTR